MTLELIVAPLAQRDLIEITDYISTENPAAALRTIGRMEQLARLLCERPFLGPSVKAPARDGLRKMTSSPYVIFYRVSGEELQIVRVLHSSRDIDEFLPRM